MLAKLMLDKLRDTVSEAELAFDALLASLMSCKSSDIPTVSAAPCNDVAMCSKTRTTGAPTSQLTMKSTRVSSGDLVQGVHAPSVFP
jgi:hypothetical protein